MPNNVKVEAQDLSEQVKWVSNGVNKLNTSPYVRMKFFDGHIEISSIDESNAYKGKIDIIEQEGEFEELLLDGEMLSKIPKILKGGIVNLAFNKTSMSVKAEVAKIDIPIIKNERVPKLPEMPHSIGTVLSEDFAKAVKQVSKSASGEIDKSLIILTCISVEIIPSESIIKLTSTDRYSLAHKKIPYTPSSTEGEPISFALKARSLAQAATDMSNGGIITIHASPETKKFGLTNDMKSVYLGVTGEDYVKYQRLLEGKTNETANVDKRILNSAISDVSTFNKLDYIIFVFEDNAVEIKGSNMNMNIDVAYTGEKKTVKFKTEVIRKAMSFINQNMINMHFPEVERQGVVIREVNEGLEDANFFGLIMPMV